MANSLLLTGLVTFQEAGQSKYSVGKGGLAVTLTGLAELLLEFATSTVETALPLGGVVPRWCYFENLDPTNAITIKASNGGQKLFTLNPGEIALGPLDSSITAPTVVAAAGTPVLKYALWPN